MPCKRMSEDRSSPNYKKWYCYFYYTNSQGKKVKKKKEGFLSKKEAIEYENNFITSHRYDSEMTFKQLYEEYMKDALLNCGKGTYLRKEYTFNSKILPYFSSYPISKITPNVIRQWQNSMMSLEDQYKDTYLKSLNNELSTILNFAVKFYDLPSNPLKICGSMGSKKTDNEMLFWTEDEFTIFIKNVENKPMSKVLFTLLFYTGMRSGEALALTLDDFNFENNYVNINKTYKRLNKEDIIKEPKTRKSKRKIAITSFLEKIVKEYSEKLYDYQPNERLFPVTNHYLAHEIKRGIKGTSLKKIRVHDFRHSHTALLIEMKKEIYEISERLGHESYKTTLDTYAHLYPNKQNEIAMELEERYMKQRINKNES